MKKLYKMFYREFRIFGSGRGTSYKKWQDVLAGEAAFDSYKNRKVKFTGSIKNGR